MLLPKINCDISDVFKKSLLNEWFSIRRLFKELFIANSEFKTNWDKGVSLSINKEAKELLAEEGYDEVYGARELGRVIQEKVKKPMAEELIFGKLSKGGHVEITCKDKKISFEFSNKQEVKKELA